jgi:1-deoxy-D-xylulose-5-phosphate synthase
MASILDAISCPADLRELPPEQVPEVADALRSEIVEVISKTGGHLAASLGAVEIATALHYTFDTPRERLVWDVGHQAYAHKMLTGRRDRFPTLGQVNGIGKFLRRSESEYDVFGAGHAGTSVSAAVGIAEAIRRRGGDEHAATAP